MVVTVKHCKKCGADKPSADFWKNRTTKDGLQAWCKLCWAEITTKRREANIEVELRQRKNRHLINAYGITMEDYEVMLESQDYACLICKLTPLEAKQPHKKLAVDHCHSTDRVRGLLCENCNRGLGMFKDDIRLLTAAISYLER